MEYYRRMLYEPQHSIYASYEKPSKDVDYVEKMHAILSAVPCIGVPPQPTQIMGAVYLGSSADAENIPVLKSMGINYILNCAGGHPVHLRRLRQLYGPETGIRGYEELDAEDTPDFYISHHFDRAHAFIDYARQKGGRVLIHCPGVSRSGAIAISYLVRSGIPLLQATKLIKDKRRTVLVNTNFMRQLVRYAGERMLLESDLSSVPAPRYGRPLDRHRIRSAHLPTFI